MSHGNPTHPYSPEITPSPKGDGSVGWAIRKDGKLLERSDKIFRSEADALKDGQKALERQFQSDAQPSIPPLRRR
jgi:hypothetical protein